MAILPNDPLFPSQWYLYNTSQPRMDINVVRVWDKYTGRGVLVGVIDDGFDYLHADLNNNYDASIDYDSIEQDSDPFGIHLPASQGGESHGTPVAGIIAAEAGNGMGGVGVAYGATITGFRAVSLAVPLPDLLAAGTDALWRSDKVDVVNNSWGFGGLPSPYNRFFDNFNTPLFSQAGQAIVNAVANGRNELGTAIVFSAGNSRAQGDNTNYHNFQNSRRVVTVAALDDNGFVTSFSTPGASILVSAFAGEPGSIVTTDRRGSAGNTSGDYTRSFGGTSAAAPMVSGVVALMLEANSYLGYRDIQEILAYSARQNDSKNQAPDRQDFWRFNGANNWNGGGLHVSHDYGFGLVDALAAVRLAETWQTQSRSNNEHSVSASSSVGWSIPDGFSQVSDMITLPAGVQIDWLEVDLDLTHPWRGDLVVMLTSPNGTESVLVNRPNNGNDAEDNLVFKLSSTHHWGESSAGNWTLTVRDLNPNGDSGLLNSWKLSLYGDLDTVDDTYIYTNEFAQTNLSSASRQTLNDTSGIDTINAAAIASSIYLNLTPGSTNSKLVGKTLNIGSGTIIEKAFGGDGHDTIIGNRAANQLYGGSGNDTLTGDTGTDRFVFNSYQDGIDRIADFEIVDDTINVSAAGFGGGLTANTFLSAAQFIIGTVATTARHRFIYSSANGELFFDSDGTGSIAQLQIATLSTGLAMTNTDIFVTG